MGYGNLRAVCSLKYSAEAWKKMAPSVCVRPAGNPGCPELSVLGSLRSSAPGRPGSSLSHSVWAAPALLHAGLCQPLQPWTHISSTADRSQDHTAHAPLSDKHQLFPVGATYWNLSESWLKTSLAQGPLCNKPAGHGTAGDSFYRNMFCGPAAPTGIPCSLWLPHRVWSHSMATLMWLWGYHSSLCCWHLPCSPQLSALSQPLVPSHLLHLHRNVGSFPQHTHLFLLDRCFISAIPAPAGPLSSTQQHQLLPRQWCSLQLGPFKDTARPAGNCCSPRGNQGRPRALTSGIYFPYTPN